MRQFLTITKHKLREGNRILIKNIEFLKTSLFEEENVKYYSGEHIYPDYQEVQIKLTSGADFLSVDGASLSRLRGVWEGCAVIATKVIRMLRLQLLLTFYHDNLPQIATISFLSKTPTIESSGLEILNIKEENFPSIFCSHHHRIFHSPGVFWSRECHRWQ